MKKLKWTTRQRKVNDLVPMDANPRKISGARRMKLIESLQKFDLVDIPVIDFDNTVISGHQRLRALQAVGRGGETIDVRYPNRKLTEQERKQYNLLANQHFGEWDEDLLREFMVDLDMSEFGFNDEDFKPIGFWKEQGKKKVERKALEEDGYDGHVPETASSQLGDLYELTNMETGACHRILCGDATKADDVHRLMDGQKADLALTDPPYNVNYEGASTGRILNDKMASTAFFHFLKKAFANLSAYLKPGGCFYIFHAESEGYHFRKAVHESRLMLKQCLIWVKQSAVLSRQDYNWQHEPVLYGWKKGAAHYFIGDFTEKTVIDHGDLNKMKLGELRQFVKDLMESRNTSAIRSDRPSVSDLHPTMKPIKLCGKFIQNSSREKELILDLFLGAGANLIAAEQLGRICYGMELDGKYCDASVKRWQDWMGREGLEYEILKNGSRFNL